MGLVLIVEDEPAIADLQRLYLAREGYGVHHDFQERLTRQRAVRARRT